MDMENNNNYGSVERQSMVADVEDVVMVKAKPRPLLLTCVLAVGGVSACYLALPRSPTTSSRAPLLETSSVTTSTLNLPSYLVEVNETDPEYAEHASQLTSSWVIGEEGEGNLIPDEVAIVRFVKPHFTYRTYGGENKASQCGYWWVLDPPKGDVDTYFDHFAICPEFNDASNIVRCQVPEGHIAVVGVGQSIDCESGERMMPNPEELQLNGDICSQVTKVQKHLPCEYCSSNAFNLELSACSNRGKDWIDGFKFDN